MGYVSPKLEAAAASTRSEVEVRRGRLAPQFGSIARVKFDERELHGKIRAALDAVETALGHGAEFSGLLGKDYSSFLDSLEALIHDEMPSLERLERELEEAANV